MRTQNGRPYYGNARNTLMSCNYCKILVKFGWRINAANSSKEQRRPLIPLSTVMFKGHPEYSIFILLRRKE